MSVEIQPLAAKRRRRTNAETSEIKAVIHAVLEANHPMTVRQIYYQLVARQVVENRQAQYQAISTLLVRMRQSGEVPWDYVEDRNRRPRTAQMWDASAELLEAVHGAYRRDVWTEQEHYFEMWLEKDALSGIFEDVLRPFGITLNVGRGYDGWSSIRNAAERIKAQDKPSTIYYWGDFDPSGEDMHRSLIERLAFFDCHPEIVKVGLTKQQIEEYNLPSDPAKTTDSRRAGFVERHGDLSVELDALPVDVLRRLIRSTIETSRYNRVNWRYTVEAQSAEVSQLNALIDTLDSDDDTEGDSDAD